MSSPYLLGLRLDGRRVLVVGGGRVAQRRVPTLLDAGASVVLVSPSVTPALDDLIADGAITWERRAYQVGDCDGAWLVHACTSDRAANAAIAAEAEAKRIWCVRADDRDASAAWTPASGRVDEISVAVTAGGDPRRAAGIRDAVVGALRDGTVDARRNRTKPVGVALVGGGPGDPGLITVRGRQLLAQADVVVADRLAPRALLDELAPDVELIDAAKIPYGRYLAQEKINELLVEHARRGRFVVRLKGGDPFVFGRGGEEMLACARAGIPVLVVPGVTSAVAVPAAEGVPVTHRGVSQEFHVISVHVAPEDPRSTVDWPGLARSPGTLVLLMAVERIAAIAHTLIREGRSPETPVMVVQDGTLPTQRALYADLSTVAERVIAAGTRPPAIVVVGDVVRVGQEIKMVRAERVP
ncbi:uroporphyrinogen-III C-methyltransferase [Sphaerisporangium siamense]|uniref:Uroporphyrin-III C-methyltransferase/precorrin-2 dehydrogenase/sirohydrochlorin ferrochelatase n=1 Tax=Sphaerisporangium siamense TaxID=795645 RepID=A0A7W7D8H6_9ACTN|nr:uroporphyrinogen-III C-methyltransferase [Sphaerisporangium siamense]MBB4701974.1 uroporphyrin-III C-methyltransferase/precorrin-2 dehydrogenase/sirohydrochlorin ferrochelatase [Sphaerisporangium siamense]GII84113.1 uroporphyrinogen-III C-methyltransferase [Sphaerisporangium siamense]